MPSKECVELHATLIECVRVMELMNQWFGENPGFDLHFEPPWYNEFFNVMQAAKQQLTGIDQHEEEGNATANRAHAEIVVSTSAVG